jgi:hypothetical protein
MADEALLRELVASFNAAATNLEATRLLLSELIREKVQETEVEEEVTVIGCSHADAIEISTLGDRMPIYLCPDCGEEVV